MLFPWINPLPENEEDYLISYIYIQKIKENLINRCWNNSALDVFIIWFVSSYWLYDHYLFPMREGEKIFLPPRNHKIFIFFSLNRKVVGRMTISSNKTTYRHHVKRNRKENVQPPATVYQQPLPPLFPFHRFTSSAILSFLHVPT